MCMHNGTPKLGIAWALLPCGRGVDDHRNTPLSHLCYPAEFGRSRSNGTSVIKEICLKNLTIMSRLSRSLKIIGNDTYRSATCDFLLTFRTNHSLSRTV